MKCRTCVYWRKKRFCKTWRFPSWDKISSFYHVVLAGRQLARHAKVNDLKFAFETWLNVIMSITVCDASINWLNLCHDYQTNQTLLRLKLVRFLDPLASGDETQKVSLETRQGKSEHLRQAESLPALYQRGWYLPREPMFKHNLGLFPKDGICERIGHFSADLWFINWPPGQRWAFVPNSSLTCLILFGILVRN